MKYLINLYRSELCIKYDIARTLGEIQDVINHINQLASDFNIYIIFFVFIFLL